MPRAESQDQRDAPFQTRLLPEASTLDQLQALLPASYRAGPDHADLAAPQADNLSTYIEKELELGRLARLSTKLWVAGRPIPPRPLHSQQLLGREIVIAEQMDLHLVWTSGRIYIKPLPRFLLEPCLWRDYLSCPVGCGCSPATDMLCHHQRLRRCALGFLFSYAALICHESDFSLAMENKLLPRKVDWVDWRRFVAELLARRIYDKIGERFYYGELRLSRLNKLQCLASGTAYMAPWNRYEDFFRDNFAWLASATVYIAVVLTAMQVGLATSLATNEAFQAASYGFTIFSILGPLVIMFLLLAVFLCILIWNWIVTVTFGKRRLSQITAPQDVVNRRFDPQPSVLSC
ncbi:uncharacterized protein PG998_015138 [Apiospora kogelbergensis]|uniref:uncharacterized protein n=1 Tax=Apiospora kogelbergensis TaxID=1337665 RepID=UPI003131A935